MNEHPQDRARNWFRWGIGLAWIPSLPLIIGLLNSFKGISEQKATGLGAVAGGLAEVYVPLGILLTVGLELGAIVLLIRSLSRGHMGRTVISVFSIGWSALILLLFSFFVWLFYFQLPRINVSH